MLQLRRAIRCVSQARRLGHADLGRQVARALLSGHRRRRCADFAGNRLYMGRNGVGYRRQNPRQAPKSKPENRLHRHLGRKPLPLCVYHERPRPGRRALRRRRRDGLKKSESDCRLRHGRHQSRQPSRIPRRERSRPRQARPERTTQTSVDHRHPRHAGRHQLIWLVADLELPRRAIRRRRQGQRQSCAYAAP